MKKSLLFLFIAFVFTARAQQPAIGSTTILPVSPTPSLQVKIVTKVTTPSSGVLVDKTFTVTHNPKEINLRICYGSGMLPATHTYADTFAVGALQAGSYAIKFKAYMSSANQHCAKIDSNEVVSTVTVGGLTTGLLNIEQDEVTIYPNPVKDKLHFDGSQNFTEIMIYQLDGRVVRKGVIDGSGNVNVEELSKGLYFIKFSAGRKNQATKFIKE